jgi:hypothetical protein
MTNGLEIVIGDVLTIVRKDKRKKEKREKHRD